MKNIFVLLFIAFIHKSVLAQPDSTINSLKKLVGNGLRLNIEDCIGDSMNNSVTLFFNISNTNLPSQKVIIDINDKTRAIAFDSLGNKYLHSKIMLAGITDFKTIQTQIPSYISVWGSITYYNVFPSIRNLSLVSFPIASSNFNGEQELRNELLEIRNVPIIWNMSKTPNNRSMSFYANTLQPNSLKKLNNGLDFTFVKCEGDIATQTTTVYFTINNPNKPNIKIKIEPWGTHKAILIDNRGNNFTFDAASLSNTANSGAVETDLPNGVLIKGSITFRNMIPQSDGIALINIPLAWKYVTEGYYYDIDQEKVELRNIKINWNNKQENLITSFPFIVKSLEGGVEMYITGCKGNKASQNVTVYYAFYNKENPIQLLSLNPWDYNKSNAIDDLGNTYSFDKNYLGNTISSGIIEKVLPSRLIVYGSITYKNILPSAKNFNLVNIPVHIMNWKGRDKIFNDVVHLKNLPIDWDNNSPVVSAQELALKVGKPENKDDDFYKKSKKLVSGCEFEFIECQGDIATNMVTVFFKIKNPLKAHQKINVDPWWGTYAKAFDENGNDYKFGNLNLGRQYGNGYLKCDLPSSLFVNGFITFLEVETTSKYLNYVSLPLYCKNRFDNNEKDYEVIEIRNLPINWQ